MMTHPIHWLNTRTNTPATLLELLKTTFISGAVGVVAPYLSNVGSPREPRHGRLEAYANWDYFADRFTSMKNGLILTTSGSTGNPKQTLLSKQALDAAAEATALALNGHGQWLVALPLHYIAGAQMLYRSLRAGTTPVYTESVTGSRAFCAEDFLSAAERLEVSPRYVSLVPTQLEKLLRWIDTRPRHRQKPAQKLLDALRRFDALLLGGSGASDALLAKATDLGINVVTTYGMTETAGGCVYNGAALPTTKVYIKDGAIMLGGTVLACGYLERSSNSAATLKAFVDYGGQRFFQTQDIGHFDATRLIVDGRRDDVVISGGIKLSLAYLREQLNAFHIINDSFVTATPDSYWGQKIIALVEPAAPYFNPSEFLSTLQESGKLHPAEMPKQIIATEKIPYLLSGKIDRKKADSIIRALQTSPPPKNSPHPLQ